MTAWPFCQLHFHPFPIHRGPPLPSPHHTPLGSPTHTLTSAASCRPRLPPTPFVTMLRDGAAPLPLPQAAGKGCSANAGDDTTGSAGGCPRAQRHAAPRPPPRRPLKERRGPGYLVCPDAASADAPCLPPPGSSRLSSLQLSAEAAAPSSASSATSAAEPLPAARGGGWGTTFSRRRGPARARTPPGPTGGPGPAAAPHAAPAAAVCAPRSLRSARRSVVSIPPPGSSPLSPRECLPSGACGGRGRGAEPAGSEALPAAGAKTLPGHRDTTGPAPLRGGWAPGDPA